MRTRILAGALAAGVTLAACGGGSGAGAGSAVPHAPQQQQTTGATATFVVKIPPKRTTGNSVRGRKYLTANVQGIEFNVSQSGHTAGYNYYAISPSASYCTAPPLGGLVCTLQVGALPGTDTFTVNTYDSAGTMLGNIISTGTVTANIVAGGSNTISIATSGVPTDVEMSVDNPFPNGPITQQIHVLATDADANVIVGPYDAPIVLQNSDTTGTATLSATSLGSASDATALNVFYNGNPLAGGATITASVTGQGANYNGAYAATMHLGPQAPGVTSMPSFLSFVSATDTPQTIQLSGQNGATAPFTADTNGDFWGDSGARKSTANGFYYFQNGCAGIANVAAGSAANSFVVSPVNPGTCMLNLGDSSTTQSHGYVAVVVQMSGPLVGATPAPQFTVTPSQISLTAAGQTANFSVNEPGFSGYWTASSSNTNVATVAAAQGAPAGTFTVSAVAAGQSLITVKDSNGLTSTVTVTVTTTTLPAT
ncbi:MAG TPA: hypothetical protein VFL13_02735 [Candidatus Baltobacteraceae bacterium]|nr:hypothetical protein [Candidatus Baltobacteraceae bacterium]